MWMLVLAVSCTTTQELTAPATEVVADSPQVAEVPGVDASAVDRAGEPQVATCAAERQRLIDWVGSGANHHVPKAGGVNLDVLSILKLEDKTGLALIECKKTSELEGSEQWLVRFDSKRIHWTEALGFQAC